MSQKVRRNVFKGKLKGEKLEDMGFPDHVEVHCFDSHVVATLVPPQPASPLLPAQRPFADIVVGPNEALPGHVEVHYYPTPEAPLVAPAPTIVTPAAAQVASPSEPEEIELPSVFHDKKTRAEFHRRELLGGGTFDKVFKIINRRGQASALKTPTEKSNEELVKQEIKFLKARGSPNAVYCYGTVNVDRARLCLRFELCLDKTSGSTRDEGFRECCMRSIEGNTHPELLRPRSSYWLPGSGGRVQMPPTWDQMGCRK
ncbi:hypothetical protein BGX23_000911 [Mortierella sp. AD031]|nr:hypothetical protein BGX23_000911 [Mortierella sp. AD031]KAG0198397.1 hypothetical protein BGX33_012365 [Mortierella sp. NVP41]